MSTATAPCPGTGRGYFWAGILLALAAFGLVVLQYRLKHLVVPWQLPVVTTLGAVVLLVSVLRRRTVPRLVALVLVGALAGLEWYFLGAQTRIDPYTGPAQAGEEMPPFSTQLADGRSFTHLDLKDGRNHVVVFFRGRW